LTINLLKIKNGRIGERQCLLTIKDGAYHGSEQAQHVEPYDVKVKIVRNGTEDIFVKRNAFKPDDNVYKIKLSAEEYAYKTEGELLLVPTFEKYKLYTLTLTTLT
jgi:hypothetical protein